MSLRKIFLLGDLDVFWREVSPPTWWQGCLTQCLCGAFRWLAERDGCTKCYVFLYVGNILPVRPKVWTKVRLRQLWLCMTIGRGRRSPVFHLKVFSTIFQKLRVDCWGSSPLLVSCGVSLNMKAPLYSPFLVEHPDGQVCLVGLVLVT